MAWVTRATPAAAQNTLDAAIGWQAVTKLSTASHRLEHGGYWDVTGGTGEAIAAIAAAAGFHQA